MLSKIGYNIEYPGITWEGYLRNKVIKQTKSAMDANICFTRANELLNGRRGVRKDYSDRV